MLNYGVIVLVKSFFQIFNAIVGFLNDVFLIKWI